MPLAYSSSLMAFVHRRTYIVERFEWDPRKAAGNLAKHRIGFADATEVLFDGLAITVPDRDQGKTVS